MISDQSLTSKIIIQEKYLFNSQKFEYWFNLTNASVAGDHYNPKLQESLSIVISRWEENQCIELSPSALQRLTVQVFTEQKYADLNDSEESLKLIYKEESFGKFTILSSSHHHYKLERNTIKLEDTWWQILFGAKETNFYTLNMDHISENQHSGYNDERFSLTISLSRYSNLYQRKTATLLEIMSLIGGLIIVSQLLFGTALPFVWVFAFRNHFKNELKNAYSELEKLNDSIMTWTNSSKGL